MPDDRFFHKCLGHSEKVNSLTDFEDLVWRSYVLAADDFGVMRFSAITLRADNDRLAKKTHKVVEKALDAVLGSGLIHTFEHQGRTYCYQTNWQDYQKITYPKRTVNPAPTPTALDHCTDNTRWLFSVFPGGKKLQSWHCPDAFRRDSGQPPESVETPGSLARVPALTQAKTNGSGFDSGGSSRVRERGGSVMAGSLQKSHLAHAWCGRVCVPEFLHNQFVQAIGKPEDDLYAFYAETFSKIAEDEAVEPDSVKFWRPLVAQKWPAKKQSGDGITAESLAAGIRAARERGDFDARH